MTVRTCIKVSWRFGEWKERKPNIIKLTLYNPKHQKQTC